MSAGTKPYDCMYLLPAGEYRKLLGTASSHGVEGVGGDANDSTVNNIEVTHGGTMVIGCAEAEEVVGREDGRKRRGSSAAWGEAPTRSGKVSKSAREDGVGSGPRHVRLSATRLARLGLGEEGGEEEEDGHAAAAARVGRVRVGSRQRSGGRIPATPGLAAASKELDEAGANATSVALRRKGAFVSQPASALRKAAIANRASKRKGLGEKEEMEHLIRERLATLQGKRGKVSLGHADRERKIVHELRDINRQKMHEEAASKENPALRNHQQEQQQQQQRPAAPPTSTPQPVVPVDPSEEERRRRRHSQLEETVRWRKDKSRQARARTVARVRPLPPSSSDREMDDAEYNLLYNQSAAPTLPPEASPLPTDESDLRNAEHAVNAVTPKSAPITRPELRRALALARRGVVGSSTALSGIKRPAGAVSATRAGQKKGRFTATPLVATKRLAAEDGGGEGKRGRFTATPLLARKRLATDRHSATEEEEGHDKQQAAKKGRYHAPSRYRRPIMPPLERMSGVKRKYGYDDDDDDDDGEGAPSPAKMRWAEEEEEEVDDGDYSFSD